MHKQLDQKHVNFLGHNNPPKNIKSIDFTNSAIEKLKIADLDFGKQKFLTIPFKVPRGSHLKGMALLLSKATKTKRFVLRFWYEGHTHRHVLGDYKAYKNTNDPGFTCIQVNKKQYDIYQEHTNDKGLYITSPKIGDRIKEDKITDHQLVIDNSLTLRDIIEKICIDEFPKYYIEGTLSRSHLSDIFRYLCGYNWRAKHVKFGDDTKGNGTIKFRIHPIYSRFNDKTQPPKGFEGLFKKFPSGKGVLSKEKHFNPTGSTSLYDDDFSRTIISDLFDQEQGPHLIERYLEKYQRWGTKRNCLSAISYLCNYALGTRIVKHKLNPCNLVKLKKPKEIVNVNSQYNNTSFDLEELKKIHEACLVVSERYPYQAEIIMMIMVTGRRFQETSKITWDYVKEDEGIIEIPKHINKIDVDQFVTITEPVKYVLDLLRKIPDRPGMESFRTLPWLFNSSRARLYTKNLHTDKTRLKTVHKAWCLIREMTGVFGTQRTLRKTFATLAKNTLGATGPATNLTGHTTDRTLDAFYYKDNKKKIIGDANTVGNILFTNMGNEEEEMDTIQ
mgnify:CR=1 FL=1